MSVLYSSLTLGVCGGCVMFFMGVLSLFFCLFVFLSSLFFVCFPWFLFVLGFCFFLVFPVGLFFAFFFVFPVFFCVLAIFLFVFLSSLFLFCFVFPVLFVFVSLFWTFYGIHCGQCVDSVWTVVNEDVLCISMGPADPEWKH